MANHASHAALPYPVKGARYTVLIPYLDADGDPTDPTTPDTEISKDDGAAADTAEEVSSPKNSVGMLTLSGAEMDCSVASLAAKAASGPKTTLMTLYPRTLPKISNGTLSAGSAGGGTLGTVLGYDIRGAIIKTTGGTGGGGTGGANNQARLIDTYNVGTGAFTVVPNWETTPSTDTTYDILFTEMCAIAALANIQSFGGVAGTFSSGRPEANATHWGGTAVASANVRADLRQILGTTFTEGASGRIASAFETLLNVASPVLTAASVNQTGDAYARIGAPVGASLSADIQALAALVDTEVAAILAAVDTEVAQALTDLATLLSRFTATRAGYLDNLSGGAVALASQVTSIQNNTRGAFIVPEVLERPDSGTAVFEIHLYLYDDVGNMEAPDSAPTLTLVNQAGTDLSARLDSTTMALVATGHYKAVYTSSSAHTLEQLIFEASAVEGGATRTYGRVCQLVDTTAVDFTSSDRSMVTAVYNKMPSKPYLAGTGNSDGDIDMAEATGNFPGSVASALALGTQAKADVNAEVHDVINVDAKTDPTAVPAADASLGDKLNYLAAWRINPGDQTATTQRLRNRANSATIATAALADDTTTFTKGLDS